MPSDVFHAVCTVVRRRIPGQLVVQLTDRCNAACPQCGMRSSALFARSTLDVDAVKRMIDAAAGQGIRVVSFTGGEPLLTLEPLVKLIGHAGKAGIQYIRTGTNGFLFRNSHRPGFSKRIHQLAEKLAGTPLRNFWISIDSAVPGVHEQMRGLDGVIAGIEKALPVFHDHGLYPSANLGINRNIGGNDTSRLHPSAFASETAYLRAFYSAFRDGFRRFYRLITDLGFTMANTCYPMSIGPHDRAGGLSPVYAASAADRVVRFDDREKALLFTSLLDTIPDFRSRIRIFSPLCALYALKNHYRKKGEDKTYPCHGGVDFFFVNARDGNTYPCGYRGRENFGRFWDLQIRSSAARPDCRQCDWECFRDPSELFGPFIEGLRSPLGWMRRFVRDPMHLRLWMSDLCYYRACDFFDGRSAPDTGRLSAFTF